MKKVFLILTLALMALFPQSVFSAVDDGITLDSCEPPVNGIAVCTISWSNDTGTDIGPEKIYITPGLLFAAKAVPDATNAPTASYDAKICDSATAATCADYFGADMTDMSATVSSFHITEHSSVHVPMWQDGVIYPYVSGLTDSNDDEGKIVLYIDVNVNH